MLRGGKWCRFLAIYGLGFFPQDFLPIEKQRFFSHSPRVKTFFFS